MSRETCCACTRVITNEPQLEICPPCFETIMRELAEARAVCETLPELEKAIGDRWLTDKTPELARALDATTIALYRWRGLRSIRQSKWRDKHEPQ